MLPEKLNSEMDKRYIDQQLVALEDRNLEFKAATNQFDRRKAAKYAVAIANNGGGAMFFGISDEVPRDVVGTQAFGDLAEAELWLTNAVKFKVEFSEYRYEGKRVVRLSIPGRMRGVPFEYEGQFLTRTGESLTPMTSTELKAIFQETQLPYEEEDASVTMVVGEILQALDVETLGALTKSRFPVEEAAIARELHQCRMIRPSTIPGEWVILKLGALLLAKDLNDFRLHGHQLRIIEYSGTGRQSAKFDKFFEAGYAKALPAALDFLSVVLPRHEDFSAATREDVPIYPNIALRELIANALVHQDFWETAGGNYPTVEIFADRVEISNGGIPLLDVRKFVTEVAQRNRALADMMRRLGLAENRGSGVDRSLQAMEEIHGAAPDFRSETKMTRVILRGNKRWEQLGPEERQWAAYMHCCLKWANGEFMTNASLRQRFGLPDSKVQHASTLIKELVNQKVIIIDPQGPQGNKTRRYVPFS